MRNVVFIFSTLLLLSGCATTSWVPYSKDLKPKYDAVYRINSPIIIAAQDQRPYVISGDKTELFYGLQRSLYGIPYSVNGQLTVSNDILEYINLLIRTETGKYKIQKMPIDISADGLKQVVQDSEQRPILFFQIYEWKTDVPAIGTGTLAYDLKAVVFSANGEVLAQKDTKGVDDIVNPDPGSESEKVTGRWYQKVKGDALGKILLDLEIVSALNSFSVIQNTELEKSDSIMEKHSTTEKIETEEGSKSSCTTEQILSMKNSKMSDEQITAACE